jgi:hypothetical protein
MEFLAMVFGFCAVMGLAGMYFEHRKAQMKLQAKLTEMQQGDVQKELAAIKQRLVVLERIITDKGYHLNEEFAALQQ